jgi:hypothetical protein
MAKTKHKETQMLLGTRHTWEELALLHASQAGQNEPDAKGHPIRKQEIATGTLIFPLRQFLQSCTRHAKPQLSPLKVISRMK